MTRLGPHEAAAEILAGRATAGLVVDGVLDLRGVTRPFTLPPRLTVHGNLLLSDSAVTTIPDDVTVTGGVSATRCARLEHVGRIRRASAISLQHCVALVDLRGPVETSHLELQGCTALTRLPERVSADVIDLSGCTALETLPARLTAKLVRVAGCRRLRTSPPWSGVDQLEADRDTGLPYDWRTMFVDASTARDWIVSGRARQGLRTSTLSLVHHTWVRELPAALEVRGDLNLEGCTNLARLPAHLKVTGTLTLTGCTALASVLPPTVEASAVVMPDGSAGPARPPRRGAWSAVKTMWWFLKALTHPVVTPTLPPGAVGADDARRAIVRGQRDVVVREDLRLTGLPDLSSLPGGLTVFGNLTLSDLDGLQTLPDDLRVVGSITIERCRSLSSLPPLAIGRLAIVRCDALRRLSHVVAGTLAITSCERLDSIDDSVIVTESLSVSNCPQLSHLADQRFARSLTLETLPALEPIPHAPHAGNYRLADLPLVRDLPLSEGVGSLTVWRLPALTALPDGLSLRHLEVIDCAALQALPARLDVTGDLVLAQCPLVAVVPADTRCVGFRADDLEALDHIAAPWRDLSDLRLRRCRRIVALPASLRTVRGAMDLSGCAFLTALPSQLAVNGALDLTRCRSLRRLPENLPPPLSLELQDCGLEALPATWSSVALTWGGTVMTARQLFGTATLSLDEILGERDERRRRVLRSRLGLSGLLERASPEVIDTDTVPEGTRRLLRIVTPFEPIVVLEFRAAADDSRLFWLAYEGATSCAGAARWVAHSSPSEEYDPILDEWR